MNYPEDQRPPNDVRYPSPDSAAGPMRDYGAEEEAQRLRREEKRVVKSQQTLLANKFIQAIAYLVGALELLLGLRFLLRLTAANPDNTFANVIYALSRPFVKPFSTLFISPTFNGSEHIFDVNVLVAMSAYLVLLSLAIWLVRIIASR